MLHACLGWRRICWVLSRGNVGRGLVCHYHQSIEEAWWAASGESWWTGSGRDAACPLVSEDWVEGGWKNEATWILWWFSIQVVRHIQGQSPSTCTADMCTERAGRLYQNITVVFPYLFSQTRYIVRSPESEPRPVKWNRTHENCNCPCRLLLSVQFLLLNSAHKVTCLVVTAFTGYISEFKWN